MLAKKNSLLLSLSKSELRKILYNRYRCSLNFKETRRELAHEQKNKRGRGDYMFVTRKTVLGRMHQIKNYFFELEFGNLTKKQMISLIAAPKQLRKQYKIEEIF